MGRHAVALHRGGFSERYFQHGVGEHQLGHVDGGQRQSDHGPRH